MKEDKFSHQVPMVSVVIPVYGVEQYIERCARSLFEQSLEQIEFLFIDDCSPDKSVEILLRTLNDYPSRKNQVIIHHMDHNSGQAAVRKWGMQNAKGDYLIHCDSDDWVDVSMYEKMYRQAVKDNSDIVVCDYYITDINKLNRKYTSVRCSEKNSLIADLLKYDDWCVWNKLVKRSIINNGDYIFPSDNMGEDVVLTIQNLYYSKSISYVNEPLYFYFLNDTSITHQVSIDKILCSFSQCEKNIELITAFVDDKFDSIKMRNSLDALKFVKKNMLLTVKDDLLLDKWKNTYPMELMSILFNMFIPFKEKLWALKKLLKYKVGL